MANFTPTTPFESCLNLGGISAGDVQTCKQLKQIQLRNEEIANHYYENGTNGISYFASITPFTSTSTAQMETSLQSIDDNLLLYSNYIQFLSIMIACWVGYRVFVKWLP